MGLLSLNRQYKLCRTTQGLARMHGVFFAASFLAENGVPLACALEDLIGNGGAPARAVLILDIQQAAPSAT